MDIDQDSKEYKALNTDVRKSKIEQSDKKESIFNRSLDRSNSIIKEEEINIRFNNLNSKNKQSKVKIENDKSYNAYRNNLDHEKGKESNNMDEREEIPIESKGKFDEHGESQEIDKEKYSQYLKANSGEKSKDELIKKENSDFHERKGSEFISFNRYTAETVRIFFL